MWISRTRIATLDRVTSNFTHPESWTVNPRKRRLTSVTFRRVSRRIKFRVSGPSIHHDLQQDSEAMTGYTVHTGSTEKFSKGWDRIFSGSKKKAGKSSTAAQKKSTNAKSRKKT